MAIKTSQSFAGAQPKDSLRSGLDVKHAPGGQAVGSAGKVLKMPGHGVESASAFLGAEPELAVARGVDAIHAVVKESIPFREVGELEPIKARNAVLCGEP